MPWSPAASCRGRECPSRSRRRPAQGPLAGGCRRRLWGLPALTWGTTALYFENASVSHKRYRYTGMERDDETGLQHHGARYYAPWLGRWSSADPQGIVDGLNLMAYVSDN